MASGGGGGGARLRNKNQEMAKMLASKGIYHGHRFYPWYQGINYPNLGDAGAAKARRARPQHR